MQKRVPVAYQNEKAFFTKRSNVMVYKSGKTNSLRRVHSDRVFISVCDMVVTGEWKEGELICTIARVKMVEAADMIHRDLKRDKIVVIGPEVVLDILAGYSDGKWYGEQQYWDLLLAWRLAVQSTNAPDIVPLPEPQFIAA